MKMMYEQVHQRGQEGIQGLFQSFYHKLFLSEGSSNFKKFDDCIETKVTDDLNGLSTIPGPDGLTFYSTRSIVILIIGDDVKFLCLRVLIHSESLREHNIIIISLIPQVQEPNRVTKFRLISLCNVLYKIIANCITNRMKNILLEIIYESHDVFFFWEINFLQFIGGI